MSIEKLLIFFAFCILGFGSANAEFRMSLFMRQQQPVKPSYLMAYLNSTGRVLNSGDPLLSSEEKDKSINFIDYNCRSPYATFAIALVPGAVVHGAGHFYIGDTETAWTLFKIESASFLLFGIGLFTHLSSGGHSSSTQASIIWGSYFGSIALWVGTWVYDVIGATYKSSKCQKGG